MGAPGKTHFYYFRKVFSLFFFKGLVSKHMPYCVFLWKSLRPNWKGNVGLVGHAKKKLNSRVLAYLVGWCCDRNFKRLFLSQLHYSTRMLLLVGRKRATMTTKTLRRRSMRMKTVTATYRCCDCRIHLVSSSDSSWLVTATHHQLDSCTHFTKVMTKRSRFCIRAYVQDIS